MRNLPPFLRMVWATHPGYVAGILALRLLRALVPVTVLWVGKLIVDRIVAAVAGGVVEWGELARLVALEFGPRVASVAASGPRDADLPCRREADNRALEDA